MCSIMGHVTTEYIDVERMRLLNDLSIHRGPDDFGIDLYTYKSFNIALCHRRLSIHDLSDRGHQPMASHSSNSVLVFNGEIYNFRELKDQLNYSFQSDTDTEVILAAYEEWGENFVYHIEGMFAIALYDRQLQKLILVRDRIGKKPLYYYYHNNLLVFASELKPIIAHPLTDISINEKIIGRFLTNKYINAPDSIIKDVYKLEPGMMMVFDLRKEETLSCSEHRYWSVAECYHQYLDSQVTEYETARDHLDELLRSSVRRRLDADVPVGVFLSGGYDSSLVAGIASDISSEQIRTYSIGFDEKAYDESPYARAVAEHIGSAHTELVIGESDILKQLKNIDRFYDEPFADCTQLASMCVAELASDETRVILGGDGGDEFFCGYPLYETAARVQRLDILGRLVHGACNMSLVRGLRIEDKLPLYVQTISKNRDNRTKTQFRSVAADRVVSLLYPEQTECRHPIEDQYQVDNLMIRRQLVDMDTFLPGDILCNADRATMKYSLEMRSPLLDDRIMEYSLSMRPELKYLNRNKKRILKDVTHRYIPQELLDRPKQGFVVPMSKWMRGILNDRLHSYEDEELLRDQGLFNTVQLRQFISEYENRKININKKPEYKEIIDTEIIFGFFIFQNWYSNTYMEMLRLKNQLRTE